MVWLSAAAAVRCGAAAGLALGALLLARLLPAALAASGTTTSRPTPASSKAPESPATAAEPVPTVGAEIVSAEHLAQRVRAPRASAAEQVLKFDRGGVLTRDVYVAGHSQPHPELCPSLGARLKVAILVTSAPSHRRARDAIRMTWGHFAMRSDVALAFVLGAPPDSMRAAIRAEDALYGDIVVGRSLDSYSNLTLKTLSMLEWMDSYCPRAPRLLKTDDDTFINVQKLLTFVAKPSHAKATLTIWGRVIKKSWPNRNMKSRNYVPTMEFPGWQFPTFVTGPVYLMTADVIRPLLAAAPSQRYMRLEDVFFTGVLAQQLGIRRRRVPEFYYMKVTAHPCSIQRRVYIHGVQYHEQFDLWSKLQGGTFKCIW